MHKVDGYAVSKAADEALSSFFGKSVRLVRKGPTVRPSVSTQQMWQYYTCLEICTLLLLLGTR